MRIVTATPLAGHLKAAVCMALLISLWGCGLNTVAFHGENLRENRSGINVTASGDKSVIAVTSTRYHYSLILPYSEDWKFSWKEGFLLIGSSGALNVALSATVSDEDPGDHLRRLRETQKAQLTQQELESARLIKHRGMDVLVSTVNGTANGKNGDSESFSHLNVFTARSWKRALYRLHISAPLRSSMDAGAVREEILDYATAGFSVSYMRSVDSPGEDPGLLLPWRRGGARRQN